MAYDPTYEEILTGSGGTTGAPIVNPNVGVEGQASAPVPVQVVPPPAPAPAEVVAGPAEGVDPEGPSERAARNVVGRAGDLLFDPGPGARAEPTVKIGESQSVEQGVLNPEDAARYGEAGRLRASGEAAALLGKQAVDQNAALQEIKAMREAEVGFTKLASERDNYLNNARATRDRMLQISNENAARKPAKEGILEGKTEEGKIATVLGVLMMSIGAGMRAKGGDMSGAQQMTDTLREMSQQAVREQRHAVEMGERQYNMLGNDLQQHLANLGDLELATKAAEADFMRKASIQAKQYAVDFAPVIGAAEAQAMVAKLEQDAIAAQAALLGAYGDKVKSGYQTQYTVPMRMLQQRAQGAQQKLGGQAGPGPAALPVDPAAYATPEGYFGAQVANAPAQPIDPAVAEATGMVPKPPVAVRGAAPTATPGPAPAAPAQATHTDDGTELAPWQQLMLDGRADEAVSAMPAKVRQIWAGRVKRRMDDARFKGDRDAAIEEVFGNWRDTVSRQLPAEDERSRVVTSQGQQYLAATPKRADDAQNAVRTNDVLLSSLARMKEIAAKYGPDTFTAIAPTDKTQMEGLANDIATQLSQRNEMGVIQKWDAEIWDKSSGKLAANWWRNPFHNVLSAIDTSISQTHRRRNELLRELTPREGQRTKIREVQ